MRRRLNLKLLAGLGALLLVSGLGVHLLHAYQVRRNAGALLEQAERAEAAGELAKAGQYLERYLGFVPTDLDTMARSGRLLQRRATTPAGRLRAFLVFEELLRKDPARADVRREAARLALAIGRPGDARDHLNVLLPTAGDDGELEDLMGCCEEAFGRYPQAADWLERACRHAPRQTESAVRRAALLRRRLNRPADADRVMEQMLAANPRAVPALLAHARYLREVGTPTKAAPDIAQLLQLAGDNAEVLVLAAELELAQEQIDPARRHLQLGLERYPKDATILQALARLELQANRRTEAAGYARRVRELGATDLQSLWNLADLTLDVEDWPAAREILAKLEQTPLPLAARAYLQARLRLGEQNWAEARALLEQARPNLSDAPELLKQANLLLAYCYQKQGSPDLQLQAYHSALAIDPDWLPARLGQAACLLELGRADEAADLYGQMLPQAPGVRLAALRLTVQRVLRQPAGRRDWSAAEKLWEEAPPAVKRSPEGALARAEFLLARDQLDAARQHLESARREQPKALPLRLALAEVARRQGRADDLAVILKETEADLGDSVDLRLARARCQADQPGPASADGLRRLAEKTEAFAKPDRARLLAGLVGAARQAGQQPLARELAGRLAELRPDDANVRFLRFRLALDATDADDCRQRLAELRTTEGPDGVLWRYGEAARLARFATPGKDEWVGAARTLLAEAAQRRPNWGTLAVLEAELDERQGHWDAAIDRYRAAVALGERDPALVRRLFQLLQGRKRYGDAQEVMRKLQEQMPTDAELGRLAAEVSLGSRESPERTLKIARAAADADPSDYRNALWLGQIQAALGRRDEAEASLRKAVQLGEKVPDAWVSLVLFLVRTEQKGAAGKAFADARKHLPTDQSALALAVCSEALGRPDEAERYYQQARDAQPDDPATLRQVAGHHLRAGRFRDAVPLLRRLAEQTADAEAARWARRNLALGLALTGDRAQQQEALALIERNVRMGGPAVEDRRARAMVLSTQPGQRRESIRALEESFAQWPATADERFVLARLYEADSDWPKASARLRELLNGAEAPNPLHLAAYVLGLVQHNQIDEAEEPLKELEKREPNGWRTVEAKARWLKAKDRSEEAARLVRTYSESLPRGDGGELLAAARLLEDLQQFDAAEPLYRRHAAESKRPDRVLPWAMFLTGRGKLSAALDLCEKVGADCPPEAVAAVLVNVARHPKAKAKGPEVQRVERWLKAAREKPSAPAALLLAEADLRDYQGEYPRALALYRQFVEREPNNPLALNNLAMLLAFQKKADEAQQSIDRAIQLAGEVPALMDTRGVVYLMGGQGEQAVRELQRVVEREPTALHYFHLAQAHKAVKDMPTALVQFRKARALGLDSKQLHPLERGAYGEFLTQ